MLEKILSYMIVFLFWLRERDRFNFPLPFFPKPATLLTIAVVAKLVDALRSGRSEDNLMEVQVFSTAQHSKPFLNQCLF